MAAPKATKKKIIDDWQNAFPQLSLYSPNSLYKVLGPVVVGIELIKLPRTEEYRPHFAMYPLWKDDVKTNFGFPIVLREFYSKKNQQFSISYEKHDTRFEEVVERVKTQMPLTFVGDISLKEVLLVLDEYSKMPPLSAAPNSYLQAALQESKFNIALYISVSAAQGILSQIKERNWDANHFSLFKTDPRQWLLYLEGKLKNRSALLEKIESNKRDGKISEFKHSELFAE
jgi:hypothetical protein